MKATKRIIKILIYVVLIAFIILSASLVTFTLIQKKSGEDITVFGYRYMRVLTGSMEGEEQSYEIKTIKTDSLIAVKVADEGFYKNLKVGDVITFKWAGPEGVINLTHRVHSIQESEGVYYVTTHGDANSADSFEYLASTDNTVIGKVTYANATLGKCVKFLQSKLGMVLIILVPCILLMLIEVVRIVTNINNLRIKKNKDSKIARLEKELEELKQANNNNKINEKGGKYES